MFIYGVWDGNLVVPKFREMELSFKMHFRYSRNGSMLVFMKICHLLSQLGYSNVIPGVP